MTTRAALRRQEQADLFVKPDRLEMAARSFGEFATRERRIQCGEVQRKTLSILQLVQESIYTRCRNVQASAAVSKIGRTDLRSPKHKTQADKVWPNIRPWPSVLIKSNISRAVFRLMSIIAAIESTLVVLSSGRCWVHVNACSFQIYPAPMIASRATRI